MNPDDYFESMKGLEEERAQYQSERKHFAEKLAIFLDEDGSDRSLHMMVMLTFLAQGFALGDERGEKHAAEALISLTALYRRALSMLPPSAS